jgi:hypothetical protein
MWVEIGWPACPAQRPLSARAHLGPLGLAEQGHFIGKKHAVGHLLDLG